MVEISLVGKYFSITLEKAVEENIFMETSFEEPVIQPIVEISQDAKKF